jgi:hypothetical protein
MPTAPSIEVHIKDGVKFEVLIAVAKEIAV